MTQPLISKIKLRSVNQITLSPISNSSKTLECAYSIYHFEQKDTGDSLVAAWISQKNPADAPAYTRINLTLERTALPDPLTIDLLSGNVFDIPVHTTPNSQE